MSRRCPADAMLAKTMAELGYRKDCGCGDNLIFALVALLATF